MATSRVPLQGLESTLRDVATYEDLVTIAVRFNQQRSYMIEAQIFDTIRHVKKIVARYADLSPQDFHLVLAGHRLDEDDVLQNCGIRGHTTLHAFCCTAERKTNTELDGGSGDSVTVGPDHRSASSAVTNRTSLDNSHTPQHSCSLEEKAGGVTTSLNGRFEGSSVDGDMLTSSVDETNPQMLDHQPQTRAAPAYHRFFVFCQLCDCLRPAKLRLVCNDCGNGAFLVDRGPENWDDISSSTPITGRCTSEHCACNTPRFFLSCSVSHSNNVDGTTVLLKHVNTNRRLVECVACGDVVSHVLIFPCVPGHVTCLNCFRDYCSVCLSERRFTEHQQYGYTLPCPVGCPDSHIEETHHFLLMGKELYERYKRFGAEEFVLQNGGMLCPAPDCGMGLLPDEGSLLVKCEECQFESCKRCRRAYHMGPCNNVQRLSAQGLPNMGITDEAADRASWEFRSLSLIEETTKSCPQCHTKTERSGGCMHMVCSRCSCEWCWICVKPWTRNCMAEHWFGLT